MQLLEDKEMVYGLLRLKVSGGISAGCVARKQHRETFSREQVWRALQPLELIHSDACGPAGDYNGRQ